MSQSKLSPDTVAKALRDNDMVLLQERVAILRDEVDDKYDTDGLIVKAEQYKRAPLSGTVVAIGTDVDEDLGILLLGSRVYFNRYQVSTFELDMEPFDQVVSLDVLGIRDIYWKGK